MTRLLVALVAAALATVACGGSDGELVVSAAASLSDAFSAIEQAFEEIHDDIDVVLNLGGSSTLREQIRAGAPADVFASASASIVDDLVGEGLVGTARPFAANHLVLGVPAGNPAGVRSLEDLTRPGLLVGLCAEPVPCGTLAQAVLESRGIELFAATEEPDARALATKLALGELDAALIYATDAGATTIDAIGFEGPTTQYVIAIATDTGSPAGAAAFVDFVVSETGRRLLEDEGFRVP